MTFENEIATSNYTNIPKRLEFQGGILILVSPHIKHQDTVRFLYQIRCAQKRWNLELCALSKLANFKHDFW